jgi:hypothetical protein
MKELVGGVIREVSQVETYMAYYGGNKRETVGQILTNSRADRLMKKELQKRAIKDITSIATGKSSYVTLSDGVYVSDKILGSYKNAAEVAAKIERMYAAV